MSKVKPGFARRGPGNLKPLRKRQVFERMWNLKNAGFSLRKISNFSGFFFFFRKKLKNVSSY